MFKMIFLLLNEKDNIWNVKLLDLKFQNFNYKLITNLKTK